MSDHDSGVDSDTDALDNEPMVEIVIGPDIAGAASAAAAAAVAAVEMVTQNDNDDTMVDAVMEHNNVSQQHLDANNNDNNNIENVNEMESSSSDPMVINHSSSSTSSSSSSCILSPSSSGQSSSSKTSTFFNHTTSASSSFNSKSFTNSSSSVTPNWNHLVINIAGSSTQHSDGRKNSLEGESMRFVLQNSNNTNQQSKLNSSLSSDQSRCSSGSSSVQTFDFKMDPTALANLYSMYEQDAQNASKQSQHHQQQLAPQQRRKYVRLRWANTGNYDHHLVERCERRLRLAANGNDVETVVRMLHKGVNVNASDERRRTALHFASCHGYFDVAYILLEHGADPNQQDVVGNTPLHLAICSSKLDVVILLLRNGANCNSSDRSGRTPLQLARSKFQMMLRQLSERNNSTTESNVSGSSITNEAVNLRLESVKISIMLGIYFEKCHNQTRQKEEVDAFKEKIEKRETSEELEQDVNDLLKCLNEWSIK